MCKNWLTVTVLIYCFLISTSCVMLLSVNMSWTLGHAKELRTACKFSGHHYLLFWLFTLQLDFNLLHQRKTKFVWRNALPSNSWSYLHYWLVCESGRKSRCAFLTSWDGSGFHSTFSNHHARRVWWRLLPVEYHCQPVCLEFITSYPCGQS